VGKKWKLFLVGNLKYRDIGVNERITQDVQQLRSLLRDLIPQLIVSQDAIYTWV